MSFAFLVIAALLLFSCITIPCFIAGAVVFWCGYKRGAKK